MQTDDAARSRFLLLHGRPEPPVEPLALRAGDLELLYEDGALRLIRRGTHEVVRSIYAAVRNQHWATVPGTIHDEKIEQQDDSFAIAYEREYDWNGIRYLAHCQIMGDADGIAFSFHGTALSEFQRNRIGICVLHPVRECAGRPCRITTPEGADYDSAFPLRIQAEQPFFNVQAMRWQPDADSDAILSFEGDVFETEDQRNFADASYKTYSTPQSRAKPVAVHPGDEVTQQVTLRVTSRQTTSPWRLDAVTLTPAAGDARPLPELGLSVSPAGVPPSEADVLAVRALNISHLRVALDLSRLGWAEPLREARGEARLLGTPLDLALTFGPEPGRSWDALRETLETDPVPVRSVLLLRGQDVTDLELHALASAVRAALPQAAVGTGTAGAFIEFNGNPVTTPEFDFLSFAAHPQIHLDDNRTITENAAALADIVQSVQAITDTHAVHVAPLTLRHDADPRQKSLLGAVWALSSIKHLAEAGASSITFGPVAGQEGVLHDGMVYPIYVVLREVWGDGSAEVLPLASDDPCRVEGLLLKQGDAMRLLLGNTTPQTQSVRAAWDAPQARLRILDETTAQSVLSNPERFQGGETIVRDADGFLRLILPPFAVAVLETEGTGSNVSDEVR